MTKKNRIIKNIIRCIPLVLMVGLGILFVIYKDEITVDTIADITPSHLLLGLLFIIMLYALKSLSLMFPVAVLIAAGGYIFGVWIGLAVNIIGYTVCISVPYLMGRLTSVVTNEDIQIKYKKVESFVSRCSDRPFWQSLFLRTVFFLPCDIISLYMGSVKVNYFKYIAGSLLGFSHAIITMTIVGSKITNPKSPVFIITFILQLVVTAISVCIYFIYSKKEVHN